jgi:hypothetical protein
MRSLHESESALGTDFHDNIIGKSGQQRLQVVDKVLLAAPGYHARQVADSRRPHFGFTIREESHETSHDERLFADQTTVVLNSQVDGHVGESLRKVVTDTPVEFKQAHW